MMGPPWPRDAGPFRGNGAARKKNRDPTLKRPGFEAENAELAIFLLIPNTEGLSLEEKRLELAKLSRGRPAGPDNGRAPH